MIGSQKVVKAFTYETRAEERFDAYNTELQRTGARRPSLALSPTR
ncbi:MAG: hypothetical protein ACLUOF_11335 [Ruminococcus sp.]